MYWNQAKPPHQAISKESESSVGKSRESVKLADEKPRPKDIATQQRHVV